MQGGRHTIPGFAPTAAPVPPVVPSTVPSTAPPVMMMPDKATGGPAAPLSVQDAFQWSALVQECRKSPHMNHLNLANCSIEIIRELLNCENSLAIRKLPIVMGKYLVRMGLCYVKKYMPEHVASYLNPENINVRIESNELQYLLTHPSHSAPNLVTIVVKNVAAGLLGASLDTVYEEFTIKTQAFEQQQKQQHRTEQANIIPMPSVVTSLPTRSPPAHFTSVFAEQPSIDAAEKDLGIVVLEDVQVIPPRMNTPETSHIVRSPLVSTVGKSIEPPHKETRNPNEKLQKEEPRITNNIPIEVDDDDSNNPPNHEITNEHTTTRMMMNDNVTTHGIDERDDVIVDTADDQTHLAANNSSLQDDTIDTMDVDNENDPTFLADGSPEDPDSETAEDKIQEQFASLDNHDSLRKNHKDSNNLYNDSDLQTIDNFHDADQTRDRKSPVRHLPSTSLTSPPTSPQPSTLLTSSPTSPPPSILLKPTSPPPSILLKPTSPPPSILLKPTSPPPSTPVRPTTPPPSISLNPASPSQSVSSLPTSPQQSISTQPTSPQPSISAQLTSPPQSFIRNEDGDDDDYLLDDSFADYTDKEYSELDQNDETDLSREDAVLDVDDPTTFGLSTLNATAEDFDSKMGLPSIEEEYGEVLNTTPVVPIKGSKTSSPSKTKANRKRKATESDTIISLIDDEYPIIKTPRPKAKKPASKRSSTPFYESLATAVM